MSRIALDQLCVPEPLRIIRYNKRDKRDTSVRLLDPLFDLIDWPYSPVQYLYNVYVLTTTLEAPRHIGIVWHTAETVSLQCTFLKSQDRFMYAGKMISALTLHSLCNQQENLDVISVSPISYTPFWQSLGFKRKCKVDVGCGSMWTKNVSKAKFVVQGHFMTSASFFTLVKNVKIDCLEDFPLLHKLNWKQGLNATLFAQQIYSKGDKGYHLEYSNGTVAFDVPFDILCDLLMLLPDAELLDITQSCVLVEPVCENVFCDKFAITPLCFACEHKFGPRVLKLFHKKTYCAVCMDDTVANIQLTKCSHAFCLVCFKKMHEDRARCCPYCRSNWIESNYMLHLMDSMNDSREYTGRSSSETASSFGSPRILEMMSDDDSTIIDVD